MKVYSLRRRLVAVIVLAMTIVLVCFALVLYLAVGDAAWNQYDAGLHARARALAAIAEYDEDGYELELPPEPKHVPTRYIEVWKPDGELLVRAPDVAEPPLGRPSGYVYPHGRSAIMPAIMSFPDRNPDFYDLRLPDGRAGRAVVIRFKPRDEVGNAGDMALLLGEGVEDVAATMSTIRTWFLIFGAVALVAIGGLVWWLVGGALRPLDRLAALIERIDDRSLERRLPVEGQPAELVTPVAKLNELLGRLETSFARERQFTADVSHELRTPLAGLRNVLEVTALADRSTAEYKQAVADAHAIVLQLGALVENLLVLARLDVGQLTVTNSDVNLRELVDECWKPYAALAASRELTFRNKLFDDVRSLDREKLRIIVGNLLANAAEYTNVGGWIEVTSDGALLAVTDSGPPLPDTARIFDRLWRGDTARTGAGVHCGIGLALARSLAERMGLEVAAENRSDGAARIAISFGRGGGGNQGDRVRSRG